MFCKKKLENMIDLNIFKISQNINNNKLQTLINKVNLNKIKQFYII